jgi:tetratricopeptide (TPR) repeat protein
MSRAQQFAAGGRLVLFVGAGVSALPPTSLPSWWAMDRSVVRALMGPVVQLTGADRAEMLAAAITTRQENNRFPPEYQAEVIARRLGDSYFKVLQCLDSTTPNAIHLGVAALVRAGCVIAVVTTNFDRALEAACRELEVPVEVCSKAFHFQTLAGRLDRIGEAGEACPVLKLHGSAEDPTSLIDTLAQRKKGFPPEIVQCLRHLLRCAHWLFLGYSGADLAADENYLFLRPDASEAQGFTWLLRTKEPPVEALTHTRDAYDGRAEIVHGELPDWLSEFSRPLVPGALLRPLEIAADTVEELRQQAAVRVERHAAEWVAAERFDRNVLVFGDLLDAVGEPAAAVELIQRLYDSRPAEERHSGHFGIVVDALANHYRRSSEFERAVSLFQEALAIYDPAIAEEQHAGALNNLALVYEDRGQTTEALEIYEQVLRTAEKAGNPASRGVALHNLAMIQSRLGLNDEAARLYHEELEIVDASGDQYARAFVLNNLGELEVSRNKLESATEYLEEAVRIRDRLGDDLGTAHSRANLANVHRIKKEYGLALSLYQQCLTVFRRFGVGVDVGRTLLNMARLEEDIGERPQARALIDEVLKEPASAHSDPIRAQALYLLGEIQQKEHLNHAAAQTFQEVLGIAVRMRYARQERDARVGLGIAVKELGDPDAAIALLREALALTDRHQFAAREWVVDHLADALNRSGLARAECREFEPALELFLEAVDLWRQRGSRGNEGQSLRNVGNMQVALKRYADAVTTLQEASTALTESGDRETGDQLALNAAELLLWLDRLDEASAMFRSIVDRTNTYAERAARMNQIGELAHKQLEHGAVARALRVFEDCRRWNEEKGYASDAAACLLNIGSILKAAGDVAGARRCFENALAVLEREQHPMRAFAKELLQEAEKCE